MKTSGSARLPAARPPQLDDRFTQAGVRTQETSVNATAQSRSTGSESIGARVIHNSAQTMAESDALRDQMDNAVASLNQSNTINNKVLNLSKTHQLILLHGSPHDG